MTVKDANDSTLIAEYQYDGQNRRTIKKTYVSGSLDETRHLYYSSQWQVLEERVDSSTDAERQFIWGLRYIDDLILRDRDAESGGNLGITGSGLDEPALLPARPELERSRDQQHQRHNPRALPLRRLRQVHVLTATFGARGTTLYDWEYGFTGRRLDNDETKLMYYRNRYYSTVLGRFVTRDPLGYEDGMGLYAYTDGNPINHRDALGLASFHSCEPWGPMGHGLRGHG